MKWVKKILIWLLFVFLVVATLALGVMLGWSEIVQFLTTGTVVFLGAAIWVYRRSRSGFPVFCLLLVWLILGLGAFFGWPGYIQLAGVGGVLLLWLAVWLYRWIQNRRSAALLERSLRSEEEPAGGGEEGEEFEAQIAAAVKLIEKEERELDLPWYLVIGPQGSGKSVLLSQAELNLSARECEAEGCDLKVGDAAILLDLDGRMVTEDEGGEKWTALLNALARLRPDRPINGVAICVDIAELARSEDGWELDRNATMMRQRLSETVARLGVRFPVYLVFNKCDLIRGFGEFFADLNPAERKQIWGCTLIQEEPEVYSARAVFETEFQELAREVSSRRLARMRAAADEWSGVRSLFFPTEFAALQEKLASFVEELFRPHSSQENPILRGFYFTSSAQEGTASGYCLERLVEGYEEVVDEEQQEEGEERAARGFFVRDLFSDVVLPDQRMVSQTPALVKHRQMAFWGITAAAAVVLLGFVWGVTSGYRGSKEDLQFVAETAQLAAEIRWDEGRMVDGLRGMAALDERIESLENPPLFRWGLYRAGKFLEKLQTVYYEKAEGLVGTYLYPELEKRLRRHLESGDSPYEEAYADLRAYLLLGAESDRLAGAEKEFLAEHLSGLAEEVFLQGLDEEEGEEMRTLFEPPLSLFLEEVDGEKLAFGGEGELVTDLRAVLYQEPTIPGLYALLKRRAAERYPALVLNRMFAARYTRLFRSTDQIPGVFTKEGWYGFLRDEIDAESARLSQPDWVIGKEGADLPEELRDPKAIALEIHKLYFTEYAEVWQRFLHGVAFRSLGNSIAEVAGNLQWLSDPEDSPLVLLIDEVTRQTRFETAGMSEEAVAAGEEGGGVDKKTIKMVQKYLKMFGIKPPKPPKIVKTVGKDIKKSMKKKGGEAGGDAVFDALGDNPQYYVDFQFASLHELSTLIIDEEAAETATDAEPEPPPALMELLNQFGLVASVLEGLVDDSGAKARDYAGQVFSQLALELPTALQALRASQNLAEEERAALLEEPVQQSWDAILQRSQEYLNARWRERVYDDYRNILATSYPFDQSGSDLPVEDMGRFFKPEQGTLDSYVFDELTPVVDLEKLEPYRWEGRGVRIAPPFINALKKATLLGQNLFRQDRIAVPFRLQPDLPSSSSASGPAPIVEQVCLSINGKEECYRMGSPQWSDFVWPEDEGVLGAKLEVIAREGLLGTEEFEGEWGWFRLLQKAAIRPESASVFGLQWRFSPDAETEVQINYRLQARSAYNPFANFADFFTFNCPAKID